MNELALFAGAGGGILGGKLLGWRTVCAVEWEPYAAGVLAARQNDKVLEPFPIWDDVQTFDGTPWRGIVDVVSGGFPCQDISSAGKGAGIDGERSSMWKHMARVVCEVRPEWVFVENSPMLVSRGLGTVLRDLAEIGFDAAWTVLSAAQVGAPHIRERIWICAHSNSVGWGRRSEEFRARNNLFQSSGLVGKSGAWKETAEQKARILGMDDGVAAGMDRLKATGNGQVPRVAAAAFAILAEQLMTANAAVEAMPRDGVYVWCQEED
jgi:DNA (cytosine-5)-methyltransferase 1